MKILGLVFGLCFITSFAFAEITGTIVAKDIDDNGNIRVWTEYQKDGVEIPSNYPKIDGKFVYCTRYNALNFDGLTDTEIVQYIRADIKTQTDNLIQQDYMKAKYPNMTEANAILNKDRLTNLVGEVVSSTEVTQKKMLPDGTLLKEITIKQDGTIK